MSADHGPTDLSEQVERVQERTGPPTRERLQMALEKLRDRSGNPNWTEEIHPAEGREECSGYCYNHRGRQGEGGG